MPEHLACCNCVLSKQVFYTQHSEAIDDPCMNGASLESAAPCSDMTSDLSAQDQVTLITHLYCWYWLKFFFLRLSYETCLLQAVGNTITMETQDGNLLTLSESVLSSAEVAMVTTEGQVGLVIGHF